MGRLFAVSPDTAEFLPVVTLRETRLDFIRSILIATLQSLVSSNILWDFYVLGKVIMKRVMFAVVVPYAGDERVLDICLTVITSKSRFTNPSDMFTAGDENGRCRITAFVGF
jgi:hypothetical protein